MRSEVAKPGWLIEDVHADRRGHPSTNYRAHDYTKDVWANFVVSMSATLKAIFRPLESHSVEDINRGCMTTVFEQFEEGKTD